VLMSPNGTPPRPKMVRLQVEIPDADSLRLHRLARIWREPVGLVVTRLLRRGLRSYRGEYRPEDFEGLPPLMGLPRREHGPSASRGRLRLVEATPGEAQAIMAAAELVCKAAQAADSNGRGEGEDP
jgi:hypothetical protein